MSGGEDTNEITKPLPKEAPSAGTEDEEEEEEVVRVATNLNVYYLIAGPAMYEQDTALLKHPYAPSEAKPFHLVESWSVSDDQVLRSQVIEEPATLTMWCVFGRDGTKNDVEDLGEINNRDCDNKQVYRMQQHMTSRKEMDVATVSDHRGRKWNYTSMMWSVVMVSIVAMLMAMVYVFNRFRRSREKLDIPSLDCYHSERAPLTASTDLYAHYGSQWRKRHY